jgi:hypothetical protein
MLNFLAALTGQTPAGQTNVVIMPSIEGCAQAETFVAHTLKSHVSAGTAFAGTFPERDELATLAQAEPEAQERLQAILAGSDPAVSICTPLQDTIASLQEGKGTEKLLVCALSPETQFGNPFSTAEYRHSSDRGHYRLHRFGDVCGTSLQQIRAQITTETTFAANLHRSPIAGIVLGLLLFKTNSPVQKGNWNEHSTFVDQFMHELTHHADLTLFDLWVEANAARLKQGQEPDDLFKEASLTISNKHYLPTEFEFMLSDIRAYFVSIAIISQSPAFKESGRSFESLQQEATEKVYRQLHATGLKAQMDLYGITPQNLFDFINTFTDTMKQTTAIYLKEE